MKKLMALVLAMMILGLQGLSFAERCSLPAVNTDVEIKFSGFEWYTDYRTTLSVATQRGFVNNYNWSRDHFESDKYLTPHWKTLLNSINSSAGSEQGCGGYLQYTSGIPNVAGFKVSNLKLYFLWNPDKGRPTDYTATNACLFYMARYEFDVSDNQAAYKDLVSKLKKIYGPNPYEGDDGCGTDYTLWVNSEQAAVGISVDEYGLVLIYYAPGAEDQLARIEALIKQQEIDDAADDMSGL